MAYFLAGQKGKGERGFAVLPSWSNFRARELGISGPAAGHRLFKLASYHLVSEAAQRLEEISVYLLSKRRFWVLELAITAI